MQKTYVLVAQMQMDNTEMNEVKSHRLILL